MEGEGRGKMWMEELVGKDEEKEVVGLVRGG